MDKLEIILRGMYTIYKFANDFSETEAIGILVGVLNMYCQRHNLNPEHVIKTFMLSYAETLSYYEKGGDND